MSDLFAASPLVGLAGVVCWLLYRVTRLLVDKHNTDKKRNLERHAYDRNRELVRHVYKTGGAEDVVKMAAALDVRLSVDPGGGSTQDPRPGTVLARGEPETPPQGPAAGGPPDGDDVGRLGVVR